MMKKSIKLVVLALFFGLFAPQLSHGEKLYNAQTFTLTNGLVVYLIENHRTPVVSHMVVYRVGSADDPKGKSGLAHFLEHMMFKGPKGSAPERVMEDVNKIGGQVNATTSFDVTSYYEIIPRDNLEHFMKLEASRMQDLPVRLEDLTPEIQVVLEEENMRVGNNPMMQFYRDLYSAYFRHHPYGTMPIGWRHEIKTYTPQDVKNFHRRYYAPDNAFIVLSGDLTLLRAKELCEKYYGGIAPAKKSRRQRVKEPALEGMIEITKTSARVAQPSVALMMPAPTYDPMNPVTAGALDLGIYGLGNSATGLLYRRLVEELKVATSFSLDYDPYQLDETTITIVAQSAPGVTPDALKQAIQEEIKRFTETGFTEEQLERLKTQSLSTLDYLKDSLLGGANHLIAPLIKYVPLEQIETWPEATKALKLEDVNKTLKTYLNPQYYVTGYLLPAKGEAPPLTETPKETTDGAEPEKAVPEKAVEDKGEEKKPVPLDVSKKKAPPKKTPPKKVPPKKPSPKKIPPKKASPLKAAKKSQKKGIKHA